MSRDIQKHVHFDPETGRPLPAETDFAALAAELIESAEGQGIELTGPNGLLTRLMRPTATAQASTKPNASCTSFRTDLDEASRVSAAALEANA